MLTLCPLSWQQCHWAFLSENLTRQYLDESVLRLFQSLGYSGMHLASNPNRDAVTGFCKVH